MGLCASTPAATRAKQQPSAQREKRRSSIVDQLRMYEDKLARQQLNALFKTSIVSFDPAACDYHGSLTLKEARTWSPETHQMWPRAVRNRVFSLLVLGHQLAHKYSDGSSTAVSDVWSQRIVPLVLRADGFQLTRKDLDPWRTPLSESLEVERSPEWLLEYFANDKDVRTVLDSNPSSAETLLAFVKAAESAQVRQESTSAGESTMGCRWTTTEALLVSDGKLHSLVIHCTPSISE